MAKRNKKLTEILRMALAEAGANPKPEIMNFLVKVEAEKHVRPSILREIDDYMSHHWQKHTITERSLIQAIRHCAQNDTKGLAGVCYLNLKKHIVAGDELLKKINGIVELLKYQLKMVENLQTKRLQELHEITANMFDGKHSNFIWSGGCL